MIILLKKLNEGGQYGEGKPSPSRFHWPTVNSLDSSVCSPSVSDLVAVTGELTKQLHGGGFILVHSFRDCSCLSLPSWARYYGWGSVWQADTHFMIDREDSGTRQSPKNLSLAVCFFQRPHFLLFIISQQGSFMATKGS